MIRISIAIHVSDFRTYIESIVKLDNKLTQQQKHTIIDEVVKIYLPDDNITTPYTRNEFTDKICYMDYFVDVNSECFVKYGIIGIGYSGKHLLGELINKHNIKGDSFLLYK